MLKVLTTIARFAVPGLAAAILLPASLAGQTDPRLVRAVQMAQEGQSDSARAAINQLLARTASTDTLYPQILYTAAVVASEPDEMRPKLQRIAVEFPMSSWADDALLRLVQLDYATRELDGAARNLERLAVDFPSTPLFPHVAYWAGRTYFDLQKSTDACRWLADGMARSQDDIEIQTQLGYLYQRCNPSNATAAIPVDSPTTTTPSSAAQPVSTTPPDQPVVSQASTTASTSGTFRVQIAAVGTQAAADAAASQAKSIGYGATIVQENGLYKVRAGSFATRADAQLAAETLKAKVGGAPFVVQDK